MSIRNTYTVLLSFIFSVCQASIYCPPDKTLNCNDDIHYLQVTGKATAFNYPPSMVRYQDISNLNQCNIGTIQRIWYIDINQDHQYQTTESSCSQMLTLLGIEGQINIVFPADKTYQCKEEIASDKPTWTNGSCDVLGFHVDDTVFEIAEDACFKIFRKFTVINWCTYDHQSTSGYGKWTHTQIIKVVENSPPTINDCTSKVIGVDGDCKTDFTIKNSAYDDTRCPSELLTWTVEIDLWADGTIDYRYGLNESGIYKLVPVANHQEINITLPERVGVGKHKVFWSVRDQCGNFKTCHTIVETKDLKKPTPYMHDFLTSAFQGNVMDLLVPARIFNVGSFDNCTPSSKLKYSFSANTNDTTRTINCDNAGFQFFNIYVTDLQGNQEFIDVFMLIFDNGTCNISSGISGRISESNANPIQNAQISLSRTGMDPMVSHSDEDGKFKWAGISLFSDYTIRPELSTFYPNRTDIADIKKLQNYIMGIGHLINFEYLAADLNGDNKIRISDLDLLKTMILQPKDEGSANWRFAAETDTIKNVTDLKTVNEVFDIMKYDGNIDFKATYLGDINGANKKETETRSIVTIYTKIYEGSTAFYLSENMVVNGLQIELFIPKLDGDVSIKSPYFEIPGHSIYVDKTKQSIRFITLEKFEGSIDQPLFVITPSQGRNDEIELTNFSKILIDGDQLSKLVLGKMSDGKNDYNIYPNPGSEFFRIKDPSAKIEDIKDMNGKPIPFAQNKGEFTLNAPPGIYFVTLLHDGIFFTKKLIIY